jgi:hypothetical protein
MRFRFKAFGLHLLGSACALTLVLGSMYLGWYRWPGWYLTSVLHIVGIVLLVDLALGPALTLIVANPTKRLRILARDVAIIVAVQLVALVYGAITLWMGRPLYYSFSVDRLEVVQANDLKSDEIALGQRQNPQLAPHWYSLPRWIWAPLPEDPQAATKIVQGSIFGGSDVIDMPRYFKPWDKGLPDLRKQLQAIDSIKYFSQGEKRRLKDRIAKLGLAAGQADALVMWGSSSRLLAVFDLNTLHIVALLRPD